MLTTSITSIITTILSIMVPITTKSLQRSCALVSPRQEDLTLHQGCTAPGDKDGHDDTRGGDDDIHGYDDRGGDGDVADDDDDDGDVV